MMFGSGLEYSDEIPKFFGSAAHLYLVSRTIYWSLAKTSTAGDYSNIQVHVCIAKNLDRFCMAPSNVPNGEAVDLLLPF